MENYKHPEPMAFPEIFCCGYAREFPVRSFGGVSRPKLILGLHGSSSHRLLFDSKI